MTYLHREFWKEENWTPNILTFPDGGGMCPALFQVLEDTYRLLSATTRLPYNSRGNAVLHPVVYSEGFLPYQDYKNKFYWERQYFSNLWLIDRERKWIVQKTLAIEDQNHRVDVYHLLLPVHAVCFEWTTIGWGRWLAVSPYQESVQRSRIRERYRAFLQHQVDIGMLEKSHLGRMEYYPFALTTGIHYLRTHRRMYQVKLTERPGEKMQVDSVMSAPIWTSGSEQNMDYRWGGIFPVNIAKPVSPNRLRFEIDYEALAALPGEKKERKQ